MRVLLVEDDPRMADALRAALSARGVLVDHVATLALAEDAVAAGGHDAVLLDRRMPDGDGLDFLRTLRARRAAVPVIVLTAQGELEDRIAGLDGGADDYLAKPFAVEELLARLRSVLRRPGGLAADVVRIGRLAFDHGHRTATVGGADLDLPRRELLVLEALLRRKGRTVPRAVLEDAVYGFDDEIQSNALDTHVSRLRRRLAEAEAGLEIHGIRGIGYLLKAGA
ncbi:response regulator transcription factor [Rhodoplanes serenus]|uniref:response regulator transcription factor n=1 Tax=Rhodoplanes serenus TaxID=200615 RepID=UPI000DAB68BD|nr:response regulator transcription factor [Rhodoplanes serenus]RAI36527.1 DNA-binding response regulator [Rhodoplanes serenus]